MLSMNHGKIHVGDGLQLVHVSLFKRLNPSSRKFSSCNALPICEKQERCYMGLPLSEVGWWADGRCREVH